MFRRKPKPKPEPKMEIVQLGNSNNFAVRTGEKYYHRDYGKKKYSNSNEIQAYTWDKPEYILEYCVVDSLEKAEAIAQMVSLVDPAGAHTIKSF